MLGASNLELAVHKIILGNSSNLLMPNISYSHLQDIRLGGC